MVFNVLKRGWHKAQALSILQNGFNQPLKEPLPALVNMDLKACQRMVEDVGGTPFDTAYSYLILKWEAQLRAGKLPKGSEFGSALGQMSGLKPRLKLYDQHMVGLRRIAEWVKLTREGKPLPVTMATEARP